MYPVDYNESMNTVLNQVLWHDGLGFGDHGSFKQRRLLRELVTHYFPILSNTFHKSRLVG